jgi:[protein-PII] uridylyltransferase
MRATVPPDLPRRLPPAQPRSGVSQQARRALRQLLEDDARAAAARFGMGADALDLVRGRAAVVGEVLGHAWRACLGDVSGCALFAVGGFGRGLLFPHSDIDLLVLAEAAAMPREARAIEAFLACLWDIGLKPGHAVRTLAGCRTLAASEVSVYTSLLDARRLAGDAACAGALAGIVDDPGLWPPDAFLAAKKAEQAARHARFGDTAYNLEPNLKEGPGGLRTLDLMRWLGRRITGAGEFPAMAGAGLIDAAELTDLQHAGALLARYRYALHLAAGRAEERLLFDHQRALAATFGYRDAHAGNLAVEQFMQAYYRAATAVERLGLQLVERFTELLEPVAAAPRVLDGDFRAIGARIEPASPDLFLRRPRALVDVFTVQLDHPGLRGLSAQSMRLLQQALARHGDAFAADPEVMVAFLALLRHGAPAVESLARMNRHGVLAALLPEFRRVVGRMQYDLFHAYTVDEHTVRVLRNVARFADPASATGFPLAPAIFNDLEKPELLILAALFHDIAKGRGGDHSVLGETDARAFCRRLGLSAADTELVAWLVRWHLLMSTTAQRQDISDPEVVHRFAVQVADRGRLDHLYLLTMADIAGTHPGLWNEWKARLLADLHAATRYMLRAGLGRPPEAEARIAECRALAEGLLVDAGLAPTRARELLAGFPERSFLRHRPAQMAWQARAIDAARGQPVVALRPQSARGGSSELFVSGPDRDGLFAAIAATLDRFGCSVMLARLFATPGGQVFDSFELLDAATQAPIDAARARDLEAALRRALAARDPTPRITRRSLSRRQRHFQRPPRIDFSEVGGMTQMALITSDRPGLLAEIALALREARVRVHDARIATFGERAEDFFVLSDENNAMLDEARRAALGAILSRRLGASPATREVIHAG